MSETLPSTGDALVNMTGTFGPLELPAGVCVCVWVGSGSDTRVRIDVEKVLGWGEWDRRLSGEAGSQGVEASHGVTVQPPSHHECFYLRICIPRLPT